MRHAYKSAIIVVAITQALAAAGPAATSAPAPTLRQAALLPSNVFLYIASIQNMNALQEHFKQTSSWCMYKDPSMQEFVIPAEKKVTQYFRDELTKAWKEAGIENPLDTIPWPQGQVTVALRPDEGRANVIAIADFGTNIDNVKGLVGQAAAKAVDKGFKRTQETVRGIEIEVLSPPVKQDDDANATNAAPAHKDDIIWAFHDHTALLASDLGLMKDVAIRLGGGQQESLADDAGFKKMMTKLSADKEDVALYLNVQLVIKFAAESQADDQGRENIKKAMAVLGVDAVPGVGAVGSLAANPKEDLHVKMLIAVDGPKRGLLELLAPPGKDTKPAALLTNDLSAFGVLNYDLGKIYDQVIAMIREASGMDPKAGIDMVMKQLSADEEDAQPLNLRKDILEQMTGPIWYMVRCVKPYTSPGCQKVSFAIGVRDGAALNKAIARLHGAITAKMPTEMKTKCKQDLLDCTIYVIPNVGGNLGLAFTGAGVSAGIVPGAKSANPEDNWLAIAVVGEQLRVGTLESVRQAVRDSKKDKSEVQSIATDPMYDLAGRFFPDQACMASYENGRISAEVVWTQLKEEGAKAGLAKSGEDEGQNKNPAGEPSYAASAISPMGALVKQLKNYCDFTSLPDFAQVRQYFGAQAGYMVGNEDGLYMETVYLKPPPK